MTGKACINLLIRQTKLGREQYPFPGPTPEPEPEEPKVPEKVERVSKIFNDTDFGCQEESVREILEIILDHPLLDPPEEEKEEGPPFNIEETSVPSCAVLIISEKEATYPVIFRRWDSDGDLCFYGSHSDEAYVVRKRILDLRYATTEEILKLIEDEEIDPEEILPEVKLLEDMNCSLDEEELADEEGQEEATEE